MKKIKKNIFTILWVCLLLTTTTALVAQAAYFARGKFKDVFINKQEYFSADILYSLSSIHSEKEKIESSGMEQNVSVYNHDVQTADFNAFDVTFDVYVWLTSPLPDGKEYTFSYYDNGVETKNSVTVTAPTAPLTSRTLTGGKCSTETFSVHFCYEKGDDVSAAPGLNVAVVPTSPNRLSSVILGATIIPAWSEEFSVNGSFEKNGDVEKYAAFIYRVSAVGPVLSDTRIVLKWNSAALILMTQNQSFPTSVVKEIKEGNFDSKIEWTANNNDTDVFVFFRNTKNEMWNETVTWTDLEGHVSVEFIEEAQE